MDTDRFMSSIRRFCVFLVSFAKETQSDVRFEKETYTTRGRKSASGNRRPAKKPAGSSAGTPAAEKTAGTGRIPRKTLAARTHADSQRKNSKGTAGNDPSAISYVEEATGQTAFNLPDVSSATEKEPVRRKRNGSGTGTVQDNPGEQLSLF